MKIFKKFLQTDEPATPSQAASSTTAGAKQVSVSRAIPTPGTQQVLRRAIVTEKSSLLEQLRNQYVFEITPGASKQHVAAAVAHAYGVKPLKVRISWIPAKKRRRGRIVGEVSAWKKAIVTLPAGKTIRLREAV